jgi:hypothetical protein
LSATRRRTGRRLVQDQAGRVLLTLHRANDLVRLSVFAVRARDADDSGPAAAAGSVSVELMCEHTFSSALADRFVRV